VERVFQFLIGSLEAETIEKLLGRFVFQFLIGSLEAFRSFKAGREHSGFNSS